MKTFIHILLACTLVEALQNLRPGAVWNLHGDSLSGLEWMDTIQKVPSQTEVDAFVSSCQASENLKASSIASDIFQLNVATNTVVQKLPALIDLLKQRGQLQ